MTKSDPTSSANPERADRARIIADLLRIAPHTEIVHHIPGRIRLRLKPSGLGVIGTIDVESLMRNVPGIRSLRVNPVVGSLTLEYDQSRLSHGLWEKLGALHSRPELKDQVEALLNNVWK